MAAQAENRQVERNPIEGLLKMAAERLFDVDAVAGHVGKVDPAPHSKQIPNSTQKAVAKAWAVGSVRGCEPDPTAYPSRTDVLSSVWTIYYS
jgi:hypothetical protein